MVWLFKIWCKSEIVLFKYRLFYCIHKEYNIHKDIAEDIETTYDTSDYEKDRLLPKGESKNLIWLRKDELGRQVLTKFVGLRAESHIAE